MSFRIAVLPGDDIGPEITDATLTVLDAADRRFGLGLDFEVHEVGMASYRRTGSTLQDRVVDSALAADGVILGPAGMSDYPPPQDGGRNIPGTIRRQLDLYANIRPAKFRSGIPRALPRLACTIVRENTEGFYADRNLYCGNGEFMPTLDTAIAMRLVTATASRRIAERAFDIAERRGGQVTVVGKRHVLQLTDGLFMRAVDEVAEQFQGVAYREMDVDAAAAELYLRPESLDIILTTNMFGDILSNLASALAGSLGLSASLNVGADHAAANAGHGSAPDIAGRNIANPAGLIQSASMLLGWLAGRHQSVEAADAAVAIERALDRVLADPVLRTRDLGGSLGTREFGQAVAEAVSVGDPL